MRDVTLVIADDGSSDPELLEASALSLRKEISAIAEINDLMPRNAPAPTGSKGGAEDL